MVPRVFLQFVIEIFPDHILFLCFVFNNVSDSMSLVWLSDLICLLKLHTL